MDSLRSAGLPVAGATLVGALAYYCFSKLSPSKKRKSVTRLTEGRCIVLFFNEAGTQCLNLPNHTTDDCQLIDCPVKHLRFLKRILKTAKSCVDVCLYNLTHPDLEEAIVNLIREGKKVRCVVGDTDIADKRFISRLRSEGAFVVEKISTPPPGPFHLPFQPSPLLMHHKFVIIDSKILITGSMNWTTTSFNCNYDHMMICYQPALVKQFSEEFEYLHSTECLNERPYCIKPTDVPFQVTFFRRAGFQCRPDANRKKKCEKEDCMFTVYKSILHRILTATTTVDVCVQQLTCEDLSNELLFLNDNGIKVRVICDKSFSKGTGSQMQVFIDAGISVHRLVGEGSLHHKFIIVDGKTLLSGSVNWTMQSFFGNYENILIISHRHVVSQFMEEFEKLWNSFPAIDKV